jgi:hypothetical protein
MEIAESTKAKYAKDLNYLTSKADTVNLYDHKTMCACIEAQNVGLARKKSFYVVLHHNTTDRPDVANIYREAFMKITKELAEVAKKQKMTSKEEEKWMTWPQFQEAGRQIMADTGLPIETRILAGLCTQIPPARLDYTNLAIYSGSAPADATGNFIEVRLNGTMTMELFIQDHKTAKAWGTLRRPLPRSLVKVIHEWMIAHGPGVKLFDDLTPPILGKRIARMFERHTGKASTINTLRHAYSTHMRDGEMSYEAKNTLSQTMGHSVTMSDLYRRI